MGRSVANPGGLKRQEQELLLGLISRSYLFIVEISLCGPGWCWELRPSCLSLPGLWLQACASRLGWAAGLRHTF